MSARREAHEVSDPDVLLKALRVISRTKNQSEYLADQIMAHLRLQGVSLRDIADYADLDHSTVAKRCKAIGDNLVDLETFLPTGQHFYPASDLLNLSPEKMIAEIIRQFPEYEPVKLDEVERVSRELKGLYLPPELSPPESMWLLEEAQSVFNHYRHHRESVRPEECASIYRRGILAGQWRIETLGADALSGLRERILDILGRLTAEADRRKQSYG